MCIRDSRMTVANECPVTEARISGCGALPHHRSSIQQNTSDTDSTGTNPSTQSAPAQKQLLTRPSRAAMASCISRKNERSRLGMFSRSNHTSNPRAVRSSYSLRTNGSSSERAYERNTEVVRLPPSPFSPHHQRTNAARSRCSLARGAIPAGLFGEGCPAAMR